MHLPKTAYIIFLIAFLLTTPLVYAHENDPAAALHLEWLDTSVSPEEDFYRYANGNWLKNNPIPPDYSMWGTFFILRKKNQQLVQQILLRASENKQAPPGSLEQKVGDFYFSGMDEQAINKQGITPLNPELAHIAAINDLSSLQAAVAHLHLMGVNALFAFGSTQDFKKSQEMIGTAVQGGLGLPDRDYYLQQDKKFAQIRHYYLQHIAKMFILIGDSPATAAAEADKVMTIETALAKASMSQTQQRNLQAIYHMMDTAQLQKVTPHFSWPRYFAAVGQPEIGKINLAMPDFFKAMDKLLASVAIKDWQVYLRWQLLNAFAPYLSQPFVDQDFQMNTVLTGTKKMLPRWQRVVNTANHALGFAIGKLYVEQYFSPASKQKVLEMLANIRQALRADLQTLSWMTPATREAALRKLALVEERVGYTNKWWDYSSLKIDRSSYVLNVMRANQFLIKRDLDKIAKLVDRDEWAMPPQTVNAYYDASMNNLNIPAAILQPPFFDPNAPAAVNYGAIGFVMGHEMTHAFDDQGAQFDGHGNLKNWWMPEDLVKFQAATECIVKQFSNYKVNDELPVQGKLVVGEATADLGGLILAYHAFHLSNDFKNAKIIQGFTPDQQFFLGTAHVWAGHIRPEQARNLITTDPHPPMRFRINGTLANMPEFQRAFSISNNSQMVKSDRCTIW